YLVVVYLCASQKSSTSRTEYPESWQPIEARSQRLEGGAQVEIYMPASILGFGLRVGGQESHLMSVVQNVVGATGSTADTSPFRGNMVSQALRRVDDNDLICEAQRGNRAAFAGWVRQYDHDARRLALRLTAC